MKSLENKHSNNVKWSDPKVEEKYNFYSDNFITEKQPIGKTEQFSSSEKTNNLKELKRCQTCEYVIACPFQSCYNYSHWTKRKMITDKSKHKPKFCIICGKPTPGGTICQSDDCYIEFEKL